MTVQPVRLRFSDSVTVFELFPMVWANQSFFQILKFRLPTTCESHSGRIVERILELHLKKRTT